MPEITVFDHYEVLRREDGSLFELGRGAMGITYKAFDTNLRCPVALKVINAASIHSDVARQRFVREARAAALLRHRHVASVFHLGSEGDTYFYAMEFIEGETVESVVRRGGPLLPILALRIAVQVARALNAAQKHQLVHRDIKPSNLMLVHEDEELVVKVIDFGLAKSSRGAEGTTGDVTLSGAGFVGTPHFASPEQLEERELDMRSDIYSLGVTLWYMLAGEPPFGGTLAQVMSQHLQAAPPMDRLAGAPAGVRDLLPRMLAKEPAGRPQTPLDLRADLERCIAELESCGAGAAPDLVLLPETGRAGGTGVKARGIHAGSIIGTRYELIRDLGDSNSGGVFHAEDLRDGTTLRLLVLEADWVADSGAVAQIRTEVEKLREVSHPNLLRVLGFEQTPDAACVLLEWTEGFSLLELLRSRQELHADEAHLLLRQLAAGVDHAAAGGLKHLDFALDQLLVHFPGGPGHHMLATPVDRWPEFFVKINPLGITREFATSDTWAGGQTLVGGLRPAPRETGSAHVVQSLAAVVYEMLGGTLSPVMLGGLGTQAVSRYVPVAALPEAGNEVLRQALDPQRSFASGGKFCQALEATLAGGYRPAAASEGSTAPGTLPAETPRVQIPPFNPPRVIAPAGHPPWLALTAISACAVAALGLWLLGHNSPKPSEPASVPTPELPVATPPLPAATPELAVTPPLSPTPAPTPDPEGDIKASLVQAEGYEAARDWPRAIQAYIDFAHAHPGVDTGRIRLETLLSGLAVQFEKMTAAEFEPLRAPIAGAARAESVPAMVILAAQLRTQAPVDAFAWYCAAAARGSAPAMTQAGLMVSNGAGVPQDYAAAAGWFQWAANSGDAAGRTCLAECYLHGTGVKKDEHHALDILREAVAAGEPRAMNLLGTCNHRGIGTARNYGEALRLFSRARELGFADASGNLGVLYMNGDGVPRDSRKAVNLFDEGAQAGSPYCMFLLAKCLESGTGINANAFQAEAWYRKAAAGGNPMAIEWCEQNHIPVQRPP